MRIYYRVILRHRRTAEVSRRLHPQTYSTAPLSGTARMISCASAFASAPDG
jgi:hypothetical protein